MSDTVTFESGQVVLIDRFNPKFLRRYYVATVVSVVTKRSYGEIVPVAYLVKPRNGILRRERWVASHMVEGPVSE